MLGGSPFSNHLPIRKNPLLRVVVVVVVVRPDARTNVGKAHFIFTRMSLCGNYAFPISCCANTVLLVWLGSATWLDFGLKYMLCLQKMAENLLRSFSAASQTNQKL